MSFVRIYSATGLMGYAVKISNGMRPKNLPDFFHPMFEPFPGGLTPIRFRGGRFYAVEWVQEKPTYWPDAYETEIEVGDYILALNNGGMRHIFGQHRLCSARVVE